MFAYCLNNPIINVDPSGCCTYVGYAPWMSMGDPYIDCKQTDCKTSKYYIKHKPVRKTVQVIDAAVRNIEIGFGVGLGLYGGKTILDIIEISGLIRYDLFYIGYADGEPFHYQAYYEGAEVWYSQIIGFDIHSSQGIRDNPITGSDFSWREDPAASSMTIYETGAYVVMGGRIRIGFDSISFFEELDRIF